MRILESSRILGDSLRIPWDSWDSMRILGILWGFLEILWGFLGILWGFLGFLVFYEDSMRILWGFLKVFEDSWRFFEDSLGFYEDSWRILWGFYEDSMRILWGFLEDSMRIPWGFLEDSWRILLGIHKGRFLFLQRFSRWIEFWDPLGFLNPSLLSRQSARTCYFRLGR